MLALYLWTYASSVLAHAVFLGLPASARLGRAGMAVVAVPLAVTLLRARRRSPAEPPAAAPASTRPDDRPARPARRRRRADRAHLVNAARCCAGPPTGPATVDEPVAVLLPLRDEADRVTPCLRALLAQRGVPGLRIVVLDDGSTDGTADVVRAVAGDDPGSRCSPGRRCRRAGWASRTPASSWPTRADPDADVLVFVDADVVLAPHAVAAAVDRAARRPASTLLSPYPRIVAATAGDRLVQPLLQWLWLTFLPLRAMERSRAAVAGRGRRAVPGGRTGPATTAAGGHAAVARRGAGGHRAGPGGQAGRRPDRARRRLPAGHLPDVRRPGRELRDGYTQVAVGVVRLPAGAGGRGGAAAAALRRPAAGRAAACWRPARRRWPPWAWPAYLLGVAGRVRQRPRDRRPGAGPTRWPTRCRSWCSAG